MKEENYVKENQKRSKLKGIITGILAIMIIAVLLVYFFLPFGTTEFKDSINFSNTDFSLENSTETQFYPNMRYVESRITYKIDNCPSLKKREMYDAFQILSEKTILNFSEVESNEEIQITCDSKSKIKEG